MGNKTNANKVEKKTFDPVDWSELESMFGHSKARELYQPLEAMDKNDAQDQEEIDALVRTMHARGEERKFYHDKLRAAIDAVMNLDLTPILSAQIYDGALLDCMGDLADVPWSLVMTEGASDKDILVILKEHFVGFGGAAAGNYTLEGVKFFRGPADVGNPPLLEGPALVAQIRRVAKIPLPQPKKKGPAAKASKGGQAKGKGAKSGSSAKKASTGVKAQGSWDANAAAACVASEGVDWVAKMKACKTADEARELFTEHEDAIVSLLKAAKLPPMCGKISKNYVRSFACTDKKDRKAAVDAATKLSTHLGDELRRLIDQGDEIHGKPWEKLLDAEHADAREEDEQAERAEARAKKPWGPWAKKVREALKRRKLLDGVTVENVVPWSLWHKAGKSPAEAAKMWEGGNGGGQQAGGKGEEEDGEADDEPAGAAAGPRIIVMQPDVPLDADITYEPMDLGLSDGDIAEAAQDDVLKLSLATLPTLTAIVRWDNPDASGPEPEDYMVARRPSDPYGHFVLYRLTPPLGAGVNERWNPADRNEGRLVLVAGVKKRIGSVDEDGGILAKDQAKVATAGEAPAGDEEPDLEEVWSGAKQHDKWEGRDVRELLAAGGEPVYEVEGIAALLSSFHVNTIADLRAVAGTLQWVRGPEGLRQALKSVPLEVCDRICDCVRAYFAGGLHLQPAAGQEASPAPREFRDSPTGKIPVYRAAELGLVVTDVGVSKASIVDTVRPYAQPDEPPQVKPLRIKDTLWVVVGESSVPTGGGDGGRRHTAYLRSLHPPTEFHTRYGKVGEVTDYVGVAVKVGKGRMIVGSDRVDLVYAEDGPAPADGTPDQAEDQIGLFETVTAVEDLGVPWETVSRAFAGGPRPKGGEAKRVPDPVEIDGHLYYYVGDITRSPGDGKPAERLGRLVEVKSLANLTAENLGHLNEEEGGMYCGRRVVSRNRGEFVMGPQAGHILVRLPPVAPATGKRMAV